MQLSASDIRPQSPLPQKRGNAVGSLLISFQKLKNLITPKNRIPLLLLLCGVFILGALGVLFRQNLIRFGLHYMKPLSDNAKKMITITPPATPTLASTPKPLPQGNVPFYISSTGKEGPVLKKGFLDPYDPKPGEEQKMQLSVVKTSQPTQRISVTMMTDKDEQQFQFKKVEETEEYEIWESTWTVNDTHELRYIAILEGYNPEKRYVEVTLR